MTTFFDIYCAVDWDNAVNTIVKGKSNVRYSITLHDNITIAPTIDENYTFGQRNGITILIKGKYTIYLKSIGSLLYIHEYQNIIIKDVTLHGLSDNISEAVYTEGDFYMKGYAKITGNTNSRNGGGGIYVNHRGSITMRDNSMITGNVAGEGGGIYAECTLIDLYDNVTIRENISENGGGIYIDVDGTLAMQDNANISKNKANTNGGGVYVTRHSYFIMKDNSTILENNAKNGGGVYIDDAGPSLDMNDNATIEGNTAINGGGVYIEICALRMKDNAIIKANTASDKGGGVYIESKGNLEKNGGIIFGIDEPLDLRNKASDTKQDSGHAVYWDSSPARYRNVTATPNDNTSNDDFWIDRDEMLNGDSQA